MGNAVLLEQEIDQGCFYLVVQRQPCLLFDHRIDLQTNVQSGAPVCKCNPVHRRPVVVI